MWLRLLLIALSLAAPLKLLAAPVHPTELGDDDGSGGDDDGDDPSEDDDVALR